MRYSHLLMCVSVFTMAFLTGCGSGVLKDSSGSSSSGATVLSSVTQTITTGSATVTLANVATLDFSADPTLLGKSVTVSSILDDDLSDLASDMAGSYYADFSDPKIIKVTLSAVPSAAAHVSVAAPSAVSKSQSNNQTFASLFTFVVQGYQLSITHPNTVADPDDSDDDDGASISPIGGIIDTAKSTISADISARTFEEAPDGTATAYLKVGAVAPSSVTSKVSRLDVPAAPLDASQALTLPCPLAPPPLQSGTSNGPNQPPSIGTTGTSSTLHCIERSRFNPLRVLPVKKGNSPKPPHHQGVDLVATLGTDVYVPSGGTPVGGYSRAAFDSDVAKCILTQKHRDGTLWTRAECSTNAHHGAGVYLTLQYPGYQLRLLHLNTISSALLTSDGKVNTQATPTVGGDPVATTGGTGIGYTSPHLHYELKIPTAPPFCKDKTLNGCAYSPVYPVDAFPYLASSISLLTDPFVLDATKGQQYAFKMNAYDQNGVLVESAVQNAQENGGNPPPNLLGAPLYDPTRKFCLNSTPANTLQFEPNGQTFAGINDRLCAAWGQIINAVGLVDYGPDEVISAKFSSDPTLAVSDDPLSTKEASTTLYPMDLGHGCTMRQPDNSPITCSFTKPGQTAYPGIDYLGSFGGPGGAASWTLIVSDPSIVTVVWDGDTLLFTASANFGNTTVFVYPASPYFQNDPRLKTTFNVINMNGYPGHPSYP